MSRTAAIAGVHDYVDSGAFRADLERRVAYRTEPGTPELSAYLEHEMSPAARRLGATPRIYANPDGGPFLVARRHEGDDLPTVLTYGHGDVVPAEPHRWRPGLDPWRVTVEGDRWYGRGTADNKGQHTINLAALEQVLRARGRLGFNLTILIETGEESGSPGLEQFCAERRSELSADLLIGSDGPRVAAERPTVFLGTRGTVGFTLRVALRDRSYHSGNWGGALANPATILAHAIASLVDDHGRVLVPGLRSPEPPTWVTAALADIPVGGDPGDPAIDPDWGEPGLTPAGRIVASNTLEVLSLAAGNPDVPVGAIPGVAWAHCHLRFAPGTDIGALEEMLRVHLDAHGLGMVSVEPRGTVMRASRTDVADRWVRFALSSLEQTAGAAPVLLPNLGGSLPNAAFTEILGLPTVWIPHSYPACAQHAPDEHLLGSLARDASALMTGLFWDLGAR